MTLYPIHTGNFKLTEAPVWCSSQKFWERTNPADEKNLCTWAMRSLLIEDGERLILIDTGIGDKQSKKFFGIITCTAITADKSLRAMVRQKGHYGRIPYPFTF